MQEYVSSMLHRPVNDLLNQVTCDVQVYFGDNDMMIPNRLFRMENAVTYAERVLKKFPNFAVYKLSGAGHWPMLENINGLVKMLHEKNVDLI